MPTAFEIKKQNILQQLTVPKEDYSDRSPKGSIDEGIRELVDEINALPGLVTTSSCAGRISVFLEGKKKIAPALAETSGIGSVDATLAAIGGPGGKGGGRWLFVSHDPLTGTVQASSMHNLFGLKPTESFTSPIPVGARLVHLKFEAMVRDTYKLQAILSTYCFLDSSSLCQFFRRRPDCSRCRFISRVSRKRCCQPVPKPGRRH
jgi:tRNA wybutosine-synthesizing protein 3